MKKNVHHIIRVELKGITDPTLSLLEKKLLSLEDTKVRIESPEKGDTEPGAYFSGFAPLDTFMLILTISANLATIANLLHEVLHGKKDKAGSIVFRFDKKQLEISGDFSRHDLGVILKEFSEVAKDDKHARLLDEAKRKDLEKELSHLQNALISYKKLTDLRGWKKSKEATRRLQYYQTRRKEIEKRISSLEKLLSKNASPRTAV